jgi:hypothetical protein
MNKKILVPETIALKNLINDQPLLMEDPDTKKLLQIKISFLTFVVGTLLKDPSFGKNAVTVMHAIDIKDKIKSCEPNDFIEIEQEAYDLLLGTINSPATNFNPEVAIQIGSFFKAILSPVNPA